MADLRYSGGGIEKSTVARPSSEPLRWRANEMNLKIDDRDSIRIRIEERK